MPLSSLITFGAIALAFFGCAGSGSGGSTVRIPKNDASPPHSSLKVQGRDVNLLLSSGSEPEALSLGKADSLVLVAIGEDTHSGVRDLALTGNLVATCKDSVTGKTITKTTGFLRRNYVGSNPRVKGPIRKSSQFILRAQDLAAVCKGLKISEVVGQATVSAINFKGDRASSSRLEFRMVPEASTLVAGVETCSPTQIRNATPSGSGVAKSFGPISGATSNCDDPVDGETRTDHLGGSGPPQPNPEKIPDDLGKAKS